MKQGLRRAARGAATIALTALAFSVLGCGPFFIKETASGGGTGGDTNTGDYAYVSNSAANSNYISGYVLSGGTLTPMSTANTNLGFTPSAMTVRPGNAFLYVASQSGGLYLYNIASTGLLSAGNNGNQLVGGLIAAMDVSPDGNYLFTVDLDPVLGTPSLNEYTLNSSGIPTGNASYILPTSITAGMCTFALPCGIKVAPSQTYVAVALGTAGDAIFGLSVGTINPSYIPLTPKASDFAVTMDSHNFAYFAEVGGVAVYSLAGTSATTAPGSPYSAAGGLARGIALSSSGNYVYGANQTNGTLYGFSIGATGALTAFTPPTVAGPPSAAAVAVDNTGAYLLSLGYGTGGLTMYSIGTGGALTPTGSSVDTGTVQVPALLAVTR
jgi:6-phosphogluconolactonase